MSSSPRNWIQKVREQEESRTAADVDKILEEEEERALLSSLFGPIRSRFEPIISDRVAAIQKETGHQVVVHYSQHSIDFTLPPSQTKGSIRRKRPHRIELKAVLPDKLYVAAVEDHRIDRGPIPEDFEGSYRDWYGPEDTRLSETIDTKDFSQYDIDLLLEWLVRTEVEGHSPGHPRLSTTITRELKLSDKVLRFSKAGIVAVSSSLLIFLTLLLVTKGAFWDLLCESALLLYCAGAVLVGSAFAWSHSQGKWDFWSALASSDIPGRVEFWLAFIFAPIFAFQIFWLRSQRKGINRRFDTLNDASF